MKVDGVTMVATTWRIDEHKEISKWSTIYWCDFANHCLDRDIASVKRYNVWRVTGNFQNNKNRWRNLENNYTMGRDNGVNVAQNGGALQSKSKQMLTVNMNRTTNVDDKMLWIGILTNFTGYRQVLKTNLECLDLVLLCRFHQDIPIQSLARQVQIRVLTAWLAFCGSDRAGKFGKSHGSKIFGPFRTLIQILVWDHER